MMLKKLYSIAFISLPFLAIAGNDNFETGARANGLGNAAVTLTDVWSAQNNQAGLANLEKIEAGLYYNNLNTPSASFIGLVTAFPTKAGVFGLSITNYGIPGAYTEMKAGISFAKKLSDNFNAAGAIDLLQLNQGENLGNNTSFTVEFGFQYKLSENLTVAGHVYNPIRAQISEYKLSSTVTKKELVPTDLKLGLGYRFSKKVLVVVEGQKADLAKAQFKAGLEYQYNDWVYIRTGISSNETKNSFGLGIVKDGLKFDIGVINQFNLGFYPVLSLSYQF